jgi:tripartite-type tricarboxylate transporter receptor subunit TctC
MRSVLRTAVLALTLLLTSSCEQESLVHSNIRLLIGSNSTGGDTYRVASIVADALASELGVNVKVDAVGPSAAFSTLKRSPGGSTLMLFHDQAYLGYLYGQAGYEDIFRELRIGPTVATNIGNAYLSHKASALQSVNDVIERVGAGDSVRVAIQPGGVSEIGFSALRNAIRLAYPGKEQGLVAINTGSQSDKNQQLFDGQADLISGTVQANEQYTRLPAEDQKAMRFVWLTANRETLLLATEEGLGKSSREALMAFAEPNVSVPLGDGSNFTFDKDFFLLYNREMDRRLVRRIDEALATIYGKGEIQRLFQESFLVPRFRDSGQALGYLEAKNARYRTLIETIGGSAGHSTASAPAPFPGLRFEESHHFFPRIILWLLAAAVLTAFIRYRPWRRRKVTAARAQSRHGWRLGMTVLLLVAYVLAMEAIGQVVPNAGLAWRVFGHFRAPSKFQLFIETGTSVNVRISRLSTYWLVHY